MGTYSVTLGALSSATCAQCAAGTFSSALGASSAATCLDCEAGKYSNFSSSSCVHFGTFTLDTRRSKSLVLKPIIFNLAVAAT